MQCMRCIKMEYGVEEGIHKDFLEYDFIAEDALDFEKQLEDAREVEYKQVLKEPFVVGSYIVIAGTPCADIQWFTINFGSGLQEIALHFNVRMSVRYVVRNTFRRGKWGTEETTSFRPFPFTVGSPFTIEVVIDAKETLFAVDGEHYCDYTHRTQSPLEATWIQILGIKDATLTIGQTDVYPRFAPIPLQVPLRLSKDSPPGVQEPSWRANILATLPNGFPLGHQLVVQGRLRLLLHSFRIDLMDVAREWPRPNVHAHVNVRAQEDSHEMRQLVVLNAWFGAWGAERRQRTASLVPGTKTTFRILRMPREWAVYADNMLIGELEFRADVDGVNAVRVRGDLYPEHVFLCPIGTTSPLPVSPKSFSLQRKKFMNQSSFEQKQSSSGQKQSSSGQKQSSSGQNQSTTASSPTTLQDPS